MLSGGMACTACVSIQGCSEVMPRSMGKCCQEPLDHYMFGFELTSGPCMSTGSGQRGLHKETLSDILLLHATPSRHRVSFWVVRDTSL